MVAIAPFKALRYAPHVDLAKATSPPHDCITTAQRDAFVAAEGRNIAGLVLPADHAGDQDPPASPTKFERAARLLQKWQADGTMRRDATAAYYRYTIASGDPDQRRTMSALVARVRTDATYTSIRRHEKTLHRKKRERLHLREATNADTEAIWLLYRDERGWVDEVLASNALEELARFTDEEGHEHRLWRVDRPAAVAEVTAQFDDRTLVIADGHHRYQTALDHFVATGRPGHGSILACLVRDDDPGVRIEATHRLVHGLPYPTVAVALAAARKHWDVRPLALPADARAQAAALQRAIGPAGSQQLLVLGRGAAGGLEAHILMPSSGWVAPGARGRLDSLCVTLLHERLLEACWGIHPDHPEEHLRFTRVLSDVVAAVSSGAAQVAVLPSPEPVSAVLEVAQQGHVMPQKSTYFVPKLRSGLVLGPLDEPLPLTWREQAGDPGPAQWRTPPLP